MASEAELAAPWVTENGTQVWDSTGYLSGDFSAALKSKVTEIAKAFDSWNKVDVFSKPTSDPYMLMRLCKDAMKDDVLSNLEEGLRSASFHRVRLQGSSSSHREALEEWSEDIGLSQVVHQMLKELFIYGQSVVAVEWGDEFHVKDSNNPKARKKTGFVMPSAISTLDPLCVVPYSPDVFGRYKLAWHLDSLKAAELRAMGYSLEDGIFQGWVKDSEVTNEEMSRLGRMGVSVSNLVRLNPEKVFRVTDSKPSYERFPDPSLRSVFPLLSMKRELYASDSVGLRGTANYILVVKQGSDALPAQGAELEALRENFRSLAKVPIVVSDHRLSVEIMTPNTQYTLDFKRYDLLDRRLASSALRSVTYEGVGEGDVGQQLSSRMVSDVLHHRRNLVVSLLRKIIDSSVHVELSPSRIILDNGALMANVFQNARDRKIISRETFFESLNLSQELEAERIRSEEEEYGDVFDEQVPFNSPENNQGGRPQGGGEPSKNDIKPKTGAGSSKKEK